MLAEQAQENSSLSTVVADVANGVALALDGEGGSYALSALLAQDDAVALAAVRVLGADVLAPYALGAPPGGGPDEQVVRKALAAYPPGADASEVSVWSYRGLVEASRAFLPAGGDWPDTPQAGAAWLQTDPWPRLTHRASQLAALALPGLAPALAAGLAARTEDLARGFVRAVRRRDWLQAAGAGRWLARVPDVPQSLGLDAGLVYVRRMSGGDPRVALHAAAARRFHLRGPR
ncbi:hypothetical protein SAMN05216259_108156 [Actinacidiphila guanduensis]|uniref:Uncharacterized protein n=1 Tax=Actinacidiphila guanduensis TaxID=310781 RepID=A0A1H0HRI2_9ACTN|nr:hypothetical protein SAMN05216259_108156 [Actinacidiphila guanduensis]